MGRDRDANHEVSGRDGDRDADFTQPRPALDDYVINRDCSCSVIKISARNRESRSWIAGAGLRCVVSSRVWIFCLESVSFSRYILPTTRAAGSIFERISRTERRPSLTTSVLRALR